MIGKQFNKEWGLMMFDGLTRLRLKWKISRRLVCALLGGSSFFPAIGCQSTEHHRELTNQSQSNLLSRSRSTSPTLKSSQRDPLNSNDVIPASFSSESSNTDQSETSSNLDLGMALRLAGVENPTIQLAQERVQEALADQLAAQSLLLPSLNFGVNYYLHRGILQTTAGQMQEVDRQGLYLGSGVRAVGGGTLAAPGVWLFAHLGDAAYQPIIAHQRFHARQSQSQAVQNAVLLDVSIAYLQFVGAQARLKVLRQGESDLAEILRLTKVYAARGQGRQADADRVAANANLLNKQLHEGEEEVAVASARLCRLINLDPSTTLQIPSATIEPLQLISKDTPLEELLTRAIQARPEVFARSAEIQESQSRVRQERVRPWLPLVSVGFSAGTFGGGSNLTSSDFGPFNSRTNIDVTAVWGLENFGFGNNARVRQARAEVGQAVARYDVSLNQIRKEVAESLADSNGAAQQIETLKQSLIIADEGFQLEKERIRQAQGRPIETLDSFRQLLETKQELIRSIVAFDVAQFRLFVAVGCNPLTENVMK